MDSLGVQAATRLTEGFLFHDGIKPSCGSRPSTRLIDGRRKLV